MQNIQQLLKHSIRKQILKGNKKINHRAYVRSLPIFNKIPYLIKYHKKKVIFSILVGVIIKTYDLQKSIYRKIMNIRSPYHYFQSFFIPSKAQEQTILQQSFAGLTINNKTLQFLSKLYYELDKQLFFGVGRNYLFQVYSQLGTIKNQQERRKFWVASGFYKQRNQKASGVGFVEFLQMFEEAFIFMRKSNPELSQDEFVRQFSSILISNITSIKAWERNFNKSRVKEFLKNQISDNQKKQDAILQIMKENPNFSEKQLEKQVQRIGLRGLNLQDRFLYWEIRKTWILLKSYNMNKKIGHPLATESEKFHLKSDIEGISQEVEEINKLLEGILKEYRLTYNHELLSTDEK